MSNKKKKKKNENLPGIILVVSALILGALIVVLVANNKKKIVIDGNQSTESREIKGDVPLPQELIEADKTTYFSVMEIPDMIFAKINGVSFNEDCPVSREELRYLKLLYWGTDSKPHTGEMIVNRAIAEKVRDLFYDLYKAAYTIERMQLVDDFGGNDEVSMKNNNTSCFNSRKVKGTNELSRHAYGMAIDINPYYNPCILEDGTVLPLDAMSYADRSKDFKMKINMNDYAYSLFTKAGFTWGGSWDKIKDYQHFEM